MYKMQFNEDYASVIGKNANVSWADGVRWQKNIEVNS